MKISKILFGLVIAVALAVPAWAATVTATLDPADISLGDSTQLTVTVSGGAEQPTVPKIDGLEIIAVGESTQISVVNGSVTQNSSRTFSITPQKSGKFTIPALQSGDAKSETLTLTVEAGAGGVTQVPQANTALTPPPATAPGQGLGQGPVVMPPNAQDAPLQQGKYGSVEMTLPKKEFYEGELVPVEIKVLLALEANPGVNDLPQFTSDGFTMNSLSTHPEQTRQMIEGHPYAVLTWRTALTAVKPGNFALDIKIPITVVVPGRAPSIDPNDQFNNFVQNAFASMQGVQKAMNLTGSTEPLKVMPLPQAGRPAGFSGAVGLFEAEASASPTHVNAGDPVTLTFSITGHGNFDRVTSNVLAPDANWKAYTPKTKFDAQDAVGYAGTKTFEQSVIPQNGSVHEVPALTFSYFDPDKNQYETCTTAPIPLGVSGAPAAVPVAPPSPSANVAAANPAPTPDTSGPDLRTNRIESGSYVATLEPVYLSPLFLAGQALPLVALVGGVIFLRQRHSALEPDRVRLGAAQQAIRQQVIAMDAAMNDAQANAFFVHARNALQQRYGQQWGMRPEAITVTDLDARLGEAGANARTIFEMADQATYSDLHLGDADLKPWRDVVMNELAETKK